MRNNKAKDKDKINRRSFLKLMGGGVATTAAITVTGCTSKTNSGRGGTALSEVPTDQMTYRINHNTNDKVDRKSVV